MSMNLFWCDSMGFIFFAFLFECKLVDRLVTLVCYHIEWPGFSQFLNLFVIVISAYQTFYIVNATLGQTQALAAGSFSHFQRPISLIYDAVWSVSVPVLILYNIEIHVALQIRVFDCDLGKRCADVEADILTFLQLFLILRLDCWIEIPLVHDFLLNSTYSDVIAKLVCTLNFEPIVIVNEQLHFCENTVRGPNLLAFFFIGSLFSFIKLGSSCNVCCIICGKILILIFFNLKKMPSTCFLSDTLLNHILDVEQQGYLILPAENEHQEEMGK